MTDIILTAITFILGITVLTILTFFGTGYVIGMRLF